MNDTIAENLPEQAAEIVPAEEIRETEVQPPADDFDEPEMPDEDDLPPGMTREGLRQALQSRHAREICADMRMRAHFSRLSAEAEALKARYPGFDLAREMRNPVFARLTAPGVGIDPATAYEVVHRHSLAEQARKSAVERVSRAVQSGSIRPAEGALSDARLSSPIRTDPRNLSMEDRRDIRRRVERGERVTF